MGLSGAALVRESGVGREQKLSQYLSLWPSQLHQEAPPTTLLWSSLGHLHGHDHRLQTCCVLLHSGWQFDACHILFFNDILGFFSERWQQCRQDWGAHVHSLFNWWTFCHHFPVGGREAVTLVTLSCFLQMSLSGGKVIVAESDVKGRFVAQLLRITSLGPVWATQRDFS